MDLGAARRFLGVTVSKTRWAAREVRGLEFDIDIDDVMEILKKQQGKCALTGWDLEFIRGGSFGYSTNPRACTIDRIYNSGGYTKWNIQLACWMPNKIKGELSNEQFFALCKNVVDNCRV
jgi:hypothetical protein